MKVGSVQHYTVERLQFLYAHKPQSLQPAAIQFTYAVHRLPACNIFRMSMDGRDGGEFRE